MKEDEENTSKSGVKEKIWKGRVSIEWKKMRKIQVNLEWKKKDEKGE